MSTNKDDKEKGLTPSSNDKNKKELMVINEEDAKEEPEMKEEIISEESIETRQGKKEGNNVLAVVMGVAALLLVIALMFFGFRYLTTGSATHSSESAAEVIKEGNPVTSSEGLKATSGLDPKLAYNLKDASDTYGGLTVTLTKIQFRQDGTRIWVKFDNNGGKKIQLMPNVNSSLVNQNGRTYKVDSFAGDSITSIAPGAHQEFMLVYEPVSAESKRLTFNLDSVFDMSKTAWNYEISFDLP